MRMLLALLISLIMAVPAWAQTPCETRKAVRPSLGHLQDVMATGRFIAYNPTELTVIDGMVTPASRESVRADLLVLRPYFDSLITYSARDGNEHVADIAAELGFRAVVVGLWTPADPEEVSNAIAMHRAHPGLVVGGSLGNEIVLGKRGTWEDLRNYVTLFRSRYPQVPLTVSEPFAQFLAPESYDLLYSLDFLMVNIHPVFEKWFDTAGARNWAEFVVNVTGKLEEAFCGPILIKETGVPSGPLNLGFEPEKQAAFWRELEAQFKPDRRKAFAYFSAFDAPWRISDFNPMGGHRPEEAYWGMFTEKREPKAVLKELPKLKK